MAQFFANDDIVSLQDTLIPTPEETVFSARIIGRVNNGNQQILSQSLEFIQSVTRTSEGVSDVVFTPGFFSEAPSVTGSEIAAGPQIFSTGVATTTGVTVFMASRASGRADVNFAISVQRQGADYDAARAETTRLGDL